MRAVALLLSITTMLGCFPHNARKRTYAQYVEGASIVTGIAFEAIVNTGADCDQMTMVAGTSDGCHSKATVLGDVGLALMLGGLLGFVATISTAEEDKAPPAVDIKAEKPVDGSQLKLPPGVKAPDPAPASDSAATSGSAAPTAAAPAHAAQ